MDTTLNPSQASLLENSARPLQKKSLVNHLNHISFTGGTITLTFRRFSDNKVLTVRARPLPSAEDFVDCVWDSDKQDPDLSSCEFLNLSFGDGKSLFVANADPEHLTRNSIRLRVKKEGQQISTRKLKRYHCSGIYVHLTCSDNLLEGEIADFNSSFFRVELNPDTDPFLLPKKGESVHAEIANNSGMVYAGECTVARYSPGAPVSALVLKPVNANVPRFRPKQFRSTRYRLSPFPRVVFTHPLINNLISLDAVNISATGVLVEEKTENPVLLPGMVIPCMELELAAGFTITCRGQIIHKTFSEEDECVRCGIAFLDLEPGDQVRLSNMLHRVNDRKANACSRVDLDELWRFFFSTGFLYGSKYVAVHPDRAKLRKTYEKIYMDSPAIARHFIQQDRGVMQGHISMLRFYENAWILHHHAADPACFRAGIAVLERIIRHVNDYYPLPSSHMDYMMCYYRPNNRFPKKVFGGFITWLNDRSLCSNDIFAYISLQKDEKRAGSLKDSNQSLQDADPADLLRLADFYGKSSGGLMLRALDLDPSLPEKNSIGPEYRNAGLRRERRVISLRREGRLIAVFAVSISEIGLNLSNLTSCIHAFVIEPDALPSAEFMSILKSLSSGYEQEKIPLLIYPREYADDNGIPYGRSYTLWAMSTRCSDEFLTYMTDLIRFNKDRYVKGPTAQEPSVSRF
jgi:hypothetical protein